MNDINSAIVPTQQMEPIKVDNLLINFTTEFHRVWNTSGSRAKTATFWRPAPAPDLLPGYFPLGDIAIASNSNINGQLVAAVVREGESQGVEDTRGKALSRPTDYEQVWKETGSGATTRTSIWRPVPAEGYVALGLTFSNDHSKPSLNAVRCVRADLVVSARVGDLIWSNTGSGATLNFSAWNIEPPTAAAGEINFVPGTFVGVPSFSKPTHPLAAYALRMEIPLEVTAPPEAPVLSGHEPASEDGVEKVTQISRLPWFAVGEYAHPNEGFQRSQYYQLKRTDQYTLIGTGCNTQDTARPIKWKASRAQNPAAFRLFQRHTDIEVTKAWPQVSRSDVRATKFSACLHENFTHTETSSSEWSESEPHTVIAMAAKLKSVAVYQLESTYELVREDGTNVSVNFGYTDDTSLILREYPSVDQACSQPSEPLTSVPVAFIDEVVNPQPTPESLPVTDSVP